MGIRGVSQFALRSMILCAETDDALLTQKEQLLSCKSLPPLSISREDLRQRFSALKPIAEKDENGLGSRHLGTLQESPM